jgi:hypothetical protein
MTITRELQIELAIYNAGIARARREYQRQPNACADWCVRCIRPVGSNPNCETCRQALRMRQHRAETKGSAA